MAAAEQMSASAVSKVGVVGTGTIGSGWAAVFVARGFQVNAYTRSKVSEEKFQAGFERAWQNLYTRGHATEKSPLWSRVTCVATIEDCVSSADFVIESVPEDVELKQSVLAEIDRAAAAHVKIGSSTSWLPRTLIALKCTEHPTRVITTHPSIPAWDNVVEIMTTSPADDTFARQLFGDRLKFDTVIMKKPSYGHVLNRVMLSKDSEIEKEKVIAEGVVTPADRDVILKHIRYMSAAAGSHANLVIGLIGGGSAASCETLLKDNLKGAPLAKTATAVSRWFLGYNDFCRMVLVFVQPMISFFVNTSVCEDYCKASATRVVEPFAAQFKDTIAKAGSLVAFQDEALQRMCRQIDQDDRLANQQRAG